MIIATIGSTKLMLETLKDAEALLEIASRATVVGQCYDLNYRDYNYLDTDSFTVGVEIKGGEKILTFEEHLAKLEERKRKEQQTAEAATQAKAKATQ